MRPAAPPSGWVATAPGSKLLVRISTHFPEALPTANVTVSVAYLVSYEHMGQALLYCAESCECQPVAVDAHNTKRKVSLLHLGELEVTQHKECVIGVLVKDESSSGEHKFKVAQLVARTRAAVAGVSGGS
jgi:hypothetical protein